MLNNNSSSLSLLQCRIFATTQQSTFITLASVLPVITVILLPSHFCNNQVQMQQYCLCLSAQDGFPEVSKRLVHARDGCPVSPDSLTWPSPGPAPGSTTGPATIIPRMPWPHRHRGKVGVYLHCTLCTSSHLELMCPPPHYHCRQ